MAYIAEGSKSISGGERKRYYEMARRSLVEINPVLETAIDLNLLTTEDSEFSGKLLDNSFAPLTKMIISTMKV